MDEQQYFMLRSNDGKDVGKKIFVRPDNISADNFLNALQDTYTHFAGSNMEVAESLLIEFGVPILPIVNLTLHLKDSMQDKKTKTAASLRKIREASNSTKK